MKKKICVIDYPTYFPDLLPSNYFMFPQMKTAMNGTFYYDIQVIEEAVTQLLENIPLEHSF